MVPVMNSHRSRCHPSMMESAQRARGRRPPMRPGGGPAPVKGGGAGPGGQPATGSPGQVRAGTSRLPTAGHEGPPPPPHAPGRPRQPHPLHRLLPRPVPCRVPGPGCSAGLSRIPPSRPRPSRSDSGRQAQLCAGARACACVHARRTGSAGWAPDPAGKPRAHSPHPPAVGGLACLA